ncbi:hypothetical protein QAD02_018672 [Eretmocerus hayati]|uniref:Uncharacterized protein n=1 Tax=Eretmocerus hayati TaxID=131215 RepID=A0ACC2PHI5_9HYME|nr:hypothetical protein QAD02_018672 [Eretmocerus hayati]
MIEELKNKGVDVLSTLDHESLQSENNPLHLAVRHNSMKVIEFLLNDGVNPTVRDHAGKTPLHVAFERKLMKVVDRMTKNLGTLNLSDDQGMSFFHIICTTNRVDTVQSFLSNGVDINAQVGNQSSFWAGFTALHFAVEFHRSKVVELLLKSGASILITNVLGFNPFDLLLNQLNLPYPYSSLRGTYLNEISNILFVILSSLVDGEKDCISRGFSVLHAICIADCDGDSVLQRLLITHQSEMDQIINWPESRQYHKCTPLHLAMRHEQFWEIKLLINSGADLLLLNGIGQTPIEYGLLQCGYSIWDDESGSDENLIIFNNKLPIEV